VYVRTCAAWQWSERNRSAAAWILLSSYHLTLDHNSYLAILLFCLIHRSSWAETLLEHKKHSATTIRTQRAWDWDPSAGQANVSGAQRTDDATTRRPVRWMVFWVSLIIRNPYRPKRQNIMLMCQTHSKWLLPNLPKYIQKCIEQHSELHGNRQLTWKHKRTWLSPNFPKFMCQHVGCRSSRSIWNHCKWPSRTEDDSGGHASENHYHFELGCFAQLQVNVLFVEPILWNVKVNAVSWANPYWNVKTHADWTLKVCSIRTTL
jgi:hypothetical protein